ncbi:hypothetical protein Acr_00g0059220 [Actinidia rufa]|uniref:Retrotransposon Copia-like N-terminal domain-containing protein n=1 Tax=Actinidia rufa TaxID=165716 RepID=A0A7J0DPI6_9ERIC|nr:hypothetical protein Acr_00g0059220 [Actinidia rufa]
MSRVAIPLDSDKMAPSRLMQGFVLQKCLKGTFNRISSPNPKPNSHHFQPPAQPWTATCAATRQPPTPCAALRNQTASNPASCAASGSHLRSHQTATNPLCSPAQPDSLQPSLLRSLYSPHQPPKQPPPQPPNSLCAAPACAATIQPLRSLCAHADSSLCAAPVQPSHRYQQHLLLPVQPSLAPTHMVPSPVLVSLSHSQPTQRITSVLLNGKNFHAWSRSFQLYPSRKRKTRWILGKKSKLAEAPTALLGKSGHPTWIFGFWANNHMTGELATFTSPVTSVNQSVCIADGSSIPIRSQGDARLSSDITLSSVYHDLSSKKIFGRGYERDGLYYFGDPLPSRTLSSSLHVFSPPVLESSVLSPSGLKSSIFSFPNLRVVACSFRAC